MADLTYKNLQDEVLSWLDLSGDTGSILTIIKQQLNYHNQMRCAEAEWSFMIPEPPSTFTLVVNQRTYTLDASVARPIYFRNLATGEYLVETPLDNYSMLDSVDWNNDTSGNRIVLRGAQKVVLLWQPQSTDTIEYEFYKLPTDMSADGDVADIPSSHSRLLVWDTLLDMPTYIDDLSAAKIELWQRNRDAMLASLYCTYAVGQTVGNQPQYVRSMDNDFY